MTTHQPPPAGPVANTAAATGSDIGTRSGTARSGSLASALPRPVGFVLGGGASFGAVQVGMLQALAEPDLRPDLVVGTSVGSINGALLAEDPSGAASRLSHFWLLVTREMVFPGRAVERVRTWYQHHTYLVPSDNLRELIMRTLSTERIEDLALPFAATAMDLLTAEVVHLESGPLVPALLASSAVPGVYPSVRVDGRDLVDGRVVSNVPVDHALRMGARSVVVLDCGAFGLQLEAPRTLPDTIAHIAAIVMRQQVARRVRSGSSTDPRSLPSSGRDVPVTGRIFPIGLRAPRAIPRTQPLR